MLASYFLKERLNLLGKIGCCLCLIGSTLVVLHSPKTAEIENMDELLEKVQQPGNLTVSSDCVSEGMNPGAGDESSAFTHSHTMTPFDTPGKQAF